AAAWRRNSLINILELESVSKSQLSSTQHKRATFRRGTCAAFQMAGQVPPLNVFLVSNGNFNLRSFEKNFAPVFRRAQSFAVAADDLARLTSISRKRSVHVRGGNELLR